MVSVSPTSSGAIVIQDGTSTHSPTVTETSRPSKRPTQHKKKKKHLRG